MTEAVLLTGTLKDRQGEIVANTRVVFHPKDDVVGQYGAVVLPVRPEATSDETGQISLLIYPGRYDAKLKTSDGSESFEVAVPEGESAILSDLIGGPDIVITPAVLLDAQAARDAAQAAQAGSEAARDASQVALAASEEAETGASDAQAAAEAAEANSAADAVATAADRVQTGLDAGSTAADLVQTGEDAAATAADVTLTNADAAATAADRVQTDLDANATAADVISTAADADATAADRVQTGIDAAATGADRVQTGQDATASAASQAAAEAAESNAQSHASSAASSALTAAAAASVDLSGLNTSILDNFTIIDMCWSFPTGTWMDDPSKSWAQEDLNGAWLGAVANEAAARAVSGATTTDFYLNTTDDKFYKLNAGSGTTEVFRGNTAAFPRQALITAEAGRVIIWERVGADLVMWRVEPYTGLTLTSIAALNGTHVIGATTGLIVSDYAADDLGSTTLDYTTSTSPAIVNNAINDVAITILPNAPIDHSTVLEVPTIAVATDGGASAIKDDGNVWDITTGACQKIAFAADGLWLRNGNYLYRGGVPTADTTVGSWRDWYAYKTAAGSLTLPNGTLNEVLDQIVGTTAGLGFLHPNPATPTSGMVAYMTTTYLTGWMPGAIKGAWLSSTDDTDLVGAELVTNGDFATDISGWTAGPDTTLSIDSGRLKVESTTNASSYARQVISTVIGQQYVIRVTGLEATSSSSNARTYLGTSAGGAEYTNILGVGDTEQSFVFTASTTTTHIQLTQATATSGLYMLFDNVSVRLADPDRSVSAKGLAVHGTITKTAIDDSDGIVLYSGGSDSDYLEQPYNSGLAFGTAAWEQQFILKQSPNSAIETLFERQSVSAAAGWKLNVTAAGYLSFIVTDGTSTRTATGTLAIDDDVIRHVTVGYDGAGGTYIKVNGVAYASASGAALLTLNNTAAVLRVFRAVVDGSPSVNGAMALLRPSTTVMSADQLAKVVFDEEPVRAGKACTLGGTSDAVLALAQGNLLQVGTGIGRSTFKGLVRTEYEAGAVSKIAANRNFLSVR